MEIYNRGIQVLRLINNGLIYRHEGEYFGSNPGKKRVDSQSHIPLNSGDKDKPTNLTQDLRDQFQNAFKQILPGSILNNGTGTKRELFINDPVAGPLFNELKAIVDFLFKSNRKNPIGKREYTSRKNENKSIKTLKQHILSFYQIIEGVRLEELSKADFENIFKKFDILVLDFFYIKEKLGNPLELNMVQRHEIKSLFFDFLIDAFKMFQNFGNSQELISRKYGINISLKLRQLSDLIGNRSNLIPIDYRFDQDIRNHH